ncbi:MAG: hypothetical protein J6Y01_01050, partial [Spirochaetales bacterium]|nr:hypothetical protein [Spirochaetales bacterium]
KKLKKQSLEQMDRVKELEGKVFACQKEIMDLYDQQKGDDKAKVIRKEGEPEKERTPISDKQVKNRQEIFKNQKIISELNQDIEKSQMSINELEREISIEQNRLDGELDKLKVEVARLSEEEKKIIPDMDPTFKYKFERIVKNKEGLGIVTVTEGHCDGCYLVLPPEFVNKIRAGKEVQYCPNCSRILYWSENSQGIFSFDDSEDDDEYFDTDK